MRRFFIFLLCFYVFAVSFSVKVSAQETNDKKSSFIAKISDISTDLSHSNSLFSGKKGIGEWVQTSFGKFRLVSSDSGTIDTPEVWFALQVFLDSQFFIKRPVLSMAEGKNVKNIEYYWPISLPMIPSEGLTYLGNFAFPMKVTLKEEGKPLDLHLNLTAEICFENCEIQSVITQLTIPAETNYFSPYTSFISRSLEFTPNKATPKEITYAASSSDILWVRVELDKNIVNPTLMLLDKETNAPIKHKILNSSIDGKKALFILKTQSEILNEDIFLFFHAENQMWQAQQTVTEGKIPPLHQTAKTISFPIYWFFLFLLMSPSFSLFMRQSPRNVISSKEQNFKNMCFVILGTLCGALIYMFYPYAQLSTSLIWLTFGALLFAFLAFFTYQVTAFGYGFLNAIVPFFTFFTKESLTIPTKFLDLLHFFCYLSFIAAFPFLIGIFIPQISVKLSKFVKQNHLSTRISLWLDTLLFTYLALLLAFTH